MTKKAPVKWYVYLLIDPRNDMVFYVGKGSGGRCLQHVKAVRQGIEANCAKARRITDIEQSGNEVIVAIVKRFEEQEDAFDFERRLIAWYRGDGLTNIAGGQWSARELMRERAKYHLAKLKPFARWVADITELQRKLAISAFGSLEACYQEVERSINKDIADPSPNVANTGRNGEIVLGWER